MKGVFYFSIFGAIVLVLFGCQTVPHQLVREVVICQPIIVIPDPEDPYPILEPPSNPITNPKIENPTTPRDLQSRNPENGGSYGRRDPLKGGSNSGRSEITAFPSVRTPERKDKGRQ